MILELDEVKVEKLDPPEKGVIEVRDSKTIGLMLVISHKGTKSWKVKADARYSHNGDRKSKTITQVIGRWEKKPRNKERQPGYLGVSEARIIGQREISKIKDGTHPKHPNHQVADILTFKNAFNEWIKDLTRTGRAEKTLKNYRHHFEKYLEDWHHRKLSDIKKTEYRDLHEAITKKHGNVIADAVLVTLRAFYNWASEHLDNDEVLKRNPVTRNFPFNRKDKNHKKDHKQVMKEMAVDEKDLPKWWKKVRALENPIRREMHTLGLLSGLRPTALVSIRKEWIDLEAQKITFPQGTMKYKGKEFELPLSKAMVEVVKRAIKAGDDLYPDSLWLFPSKSNKTGKVIHVSEWKEDKLETGRRLRYSYRTYAEDEKLVPENFRDHLMHHQLPGMGKHYVDVKKLFPRMLEYQERVSAWILKACEAEATN